MQQPVRYQYIRGRHDAVVPHGLSEHFATERHVRRLAFGQQARPAVAARHDHVGALGRARQCDGILLRDISGRHAAPLDQQADQMLPDPLLRRQHEPSSANGIPYLGRIFH